jgi:hypothetical protein
MDLVNIIQAYDGCKRLGLEKATSKLERVINIVTADILKKVKAQATDDTTETEAPPVAG